MCRISHPFWTVQASAPESISAYAVKSTRRVSAVRLRINSSDSMWVSSLISCVDLKNRSTCGPVSDSFILLSVSEKFPSTYEVRTSGAGVCHDKGSTGQEESRSGRLVVPSRCSTRAKSLEILLYTACTETRLTLCCCCR
jgi:hypothetical protein